jgi:hypothetical protein
MKSSGEWKFRISPSFCIFDGFWKPFAPPKPKKKFTLLGGMKIYSKLDKVLWTNESDFVKRFGSRKQLTQEELLEIFFTK